MTQFAVTLERVISAPRSEVYRAWLDPTVLARWMGPNGYVVADATVDERVGGVHRVDMLDVEGTHHAMVSVIEELVPDERIVLTFRFHPDAEETLLSVTLRDAGAGRTALRLEHQRITLAPPLDDQSVDAGWSQSLAKLQAFYESSEKEDG
jgi:uncharacterized protein YndB with AHSA1/START domain